MKDLFKLILGVLALRIKSRAARTEALLAWNDMTLAA